MRKIAVLVGVIAALAIPATAIAVDLQPSHVGTTCESGGSFHFVAIGGTASSVLTVKFDGQTSVIGTPDKSNNGTAHWTIDASARSTAPRRPVRASSFCPTSPARRRRAARSSARARRLFRPTGGGRDRPPRCLRSAATSRTRPE
jgi:hypothetical protein